MKKSKQKQKLNIMDQFYTKCRTCMENLTEERKSIQLFDENCRYLLLNDCVPSILLVENDVLPQFICHDCWKEIERIVRFKQKCEESENEFKRILDQFTAEQTDALLNIKNIDELIKNEEVFSQNPKADKISRKRVEFGCDNCGQRFPSETHLKEHRDLNNCNSSLKCEVCELNFSSKKSLRRHYSSTTHISKIKDIKTETSTSIELPSFVCNQCSKSFSRADQLKAHAKSHEKTEEKYQCDICSKVYHLKSVLKEHILNHTGASKALCSFCGKSFTSKANLKQHILRHTQTKTFKCSTCEKMFVSKGELQSHSRTHTGLKPFVCDICGSAFTMSYSLRQVFELDLITSLLF
uniref:CSON011197 protein n=1 Tax=Culicoides sonorensis TaxID=179676 RepID=A0A336LQT5_CULSO